jgi:hypothetical protein
VPHPPANKTSIKAAKNTQMEKCRFGLFMMQKVSYGSASTRSISFD